MCFRWTVHSGWGLLVGSEVGNQKLRERFFFSGSRGLRTTWVSDSTRHGDIGVWTGPSVLPSLPSRFTGWGGFEKYEFLVRETLRRRYYIRQNEIRHQCAHTCDTFLSSSRRESSTRRRCRKSVKLIFQINFVVGYVKWKTKSNRNTLFSYKLDPSWGLSSIWSEMVVHKVPWDRGSLTDFLSLRIPSLFALSTMYHKQNP